MTTIAITPITNTEGTVAYCAVSNGKRSLGVTAGAALDALTSQLSSEEASTLAIVQNQRPDKFFSEDHIRRLSDLMARWRECRDQGTTLPTDEDIELRELVAAELSASGKRASAMADGLNR